MPGVSRMPFASRADSWIEENAEKVPAWDFLACEAGLSSSELQMLKAAGYLEEATRVILDGHPRVVWRAAGKLRTACASD